VQIQPILKISDLDPIINTATVTSPDTDDNEVDNTSTVISDIEPAGLEI